MLGRLRHLGSGVVMGLAGLFPGVSAGTVALLMGIHGRLIHAMANIDHRLPRDAWRALRGDVEAKQALGRLDLPFILAIVVGMLFTAFSGAKAVTWLQENHPGPVMAVFLGLILFGAVIPWRRIRDPGWKEVAWLVPGSVAAIALALAPAGSFGDGPAWFILGGMVAMPMMILPGVSGSAMLVTLGLYTDVIGAVGDFDVPLLLLFALGGVVGLLSMAKFLKWLLERHHGPTMAFLTGLLAGSVIRVWPWRTEAGFAAGLPTWPEHHLWWLAFTLLAAALIIAMERFATRRDMALVQGSDNEP